MSRPIPCIVAVLTIAVAACTQAGAGPANSSVPRTPPAGTPSEPVPTLGPTASVSATNATSQRSEPLRTLGPTASPSATSPLTGDWDTGPYRTTDYGGSKFEFHLRFYEENGVPFVLMTGWDPTKGGMPGDGDHGPYTLLPDNQIAIASADKPEIRTLYSYKLDGNDLTVTWLKNDPNAPPGDVGGPFTSIKLKRN